VNCSHAQILIHALLDNELDAGHATDVEAHVGSCAACSERLAAFAIMRKVLGRGDLMEVAPVPLRKRLQLVPSPIVGGRSAAAAASRRHLDRRFSLRGFVLGAALSGAAAATVLIGMLRDNEEQRIAGEVVSAHLRSLQPGHLVDVETSDQQTVKPWFNGKLALKPPVFDLAADDFALIGARLDIIDDETVAAIVYRRRKHVINLFVGQQRQQTNHPIISTTLQGYHARHWSQNELEFWAVSDIADAELENFVRNVEDGELAKRQVDQSGHSSE